jgi:S-formylglutathione hydrolase FrmB
MALFRIDHTSECVKVSLPLYMIVPSPYHLKDKPLESYKVLYLLHGLSDDASAWQRYTNIEILARERDLVVVMPDGGRSMYADMQNGQAYFTYLTEELPAYLKAVFHLNLARENTLIAGLSMGGYGAFKAAFLRPDLYSVAGSFSGALALSFEGEFVDEERLKEFSLVFGDLSKFPGSSNDPLTWPEIAAKDPERYPELYAACGLQDFLLEANRAFVSKARALGIPLAYVEEPGIHDWHFWNSQIATFLDLYVKPANQPQA